MTYQQFRKKPVTIEAIQWTGENLREVITFTDGPPNTRSRHAGMAWENYEDLVRRDGLKIFTLEGAMLASSGDWIIRGVKGEYYPCKPGIFEATYEPAAIEAPVQEPVAWLPTATVEWLTEYDGPACAKVTAVHNRPINGDGGIPVYTTPPDALTRLYHAHAAERKLADDLIGIVEGIDGAMNHGTWRDDHGARLKDTPQWVAFYIAARRKE
jgi:hypothetical protein